MTCDHLGKKNAHAPANLKIKESQKYSFDLEKANLIFDWLLVNKRVKLKGYYKLSTSNKVRSFASGIAHSLIQLKIASSCQNIIQDLVELKELEFLESKEVMRLDEDPFPKVVECSLIELLPHTQGSIVSMATRVTFKIFNRLVEKGVLNIPKFDDPSM